MNNSFRAAVKLLGEDATQNELAIAWLEWVKGSGDVMAVLAHDEDFETMCEKLLNDGFRREDDNLMLAAATEAAIGRMVKKAILRAVEVAADDEREYLRDIT